MQTYVANVEDGSIDFQSKQERRSRRVDASVRKDTPSLIGPQEHLGRSRRGRYTGHRERSGYEAKTTRGELERLGDPRRSYAEATSSAAEEFVVFAYDRHVFAYDRVRLDGLSVRSTWIAHRYSYKNIRGR